jgi:tetratricopeptide (TPR) repeat protein/predicted Ser/Thr protein kinase
VSEPAEWFQLEEGLITELKRSRVGARPPSIPGCEGLVEIRRGGQGVVYAGVQKATRRKVAVKVLLEGALGPSPTARRRFEREVEVVASLRHPAIVQVYDSGLTEDGRPYLVMEFAEGRPLDEHVRELHPLDRRSARAVIELLARVAEGVAHAHARGVIHRDLKPSNIRVDAQGAPRVLDFGLAKIVSDAGRPAGVAAERVSATGVFIGSVAWASPEQAAGRTDDVDVRTDVYALGVLLYSSLTGVLPSAGEGGLRGTLDRIMHTPPVRPSKLQPWMGHELESVVMRCLAKEPQRRYQSAADLAADLRRLLAGEPVLARADSAWYTLSAAVRRHRGLALGLLSVFLLVTGSALALSWLYARAVRGEQVAAEQRDQARRAADELAAINDFLGRMLGAVDPGADGRDVRVAELLDTAADNLLRRSALPDSTRAALMVRLGTSYIELGLLDEAEPLLLEARRLRHADPGPVLDQLISADNALAYLRRRQGRPDDSERHALDALDRAEQSLEPGHPVRTEVLHALGLLRMEQGRYDEAERWLRRALEESGLSASADPATIVNSLALSLRLQRRLADAESIYREQLEAETQRHGPETPYAALLMNNLGSLLHERTRFDEAEALYRRALDLRERHYGPDGVETLVTASNLAKFLTDLRRFDEAEPLHRRVYQGLQRRRGPEHPVTLSAANNYASFLQDIGRLDEAEAIFRATLEARRRVLGPEHPHSLISANNLASILTATARHDEAVPLAEEVYRTRARLLGERSRDTLISMNSLGLALQAAGRPEDAEPVFADMCRRAGETLGPDHWITGAFHGNWGRCLHRLGRLADAERELLASHRVLTAALGQGDTRSRQAASSLARLYRDLGRTDDAARFEDRR